MKLLALGIRVLYRLFGLFPQQGKIVLMSRQSARPFDYQLLEPALQRRFPSMRIVWACGREDTGGPQVGLTFRQVWHAATARLVVVDGYMPAVAIPARPHRASCVLVWHALGAIKRFGWAAVGTDDGRTREQAEAGCMHRGYDVVVAGLPEAVEGLASGLDVPANQIRVLGSPRIDYLRGDGFASRRSADARVVASEVLGSDANRRDAKVVLYAPTLRRGVQEGIGQGDGPQGVLASAIAELDAALPEDWILLVAGHPLTQRSSLEAGEAHGEAGEQRTQQDRGVGKGRVHLLPKGVSTIQALEVADCVVSDYSAVAYEAAIVGKRLLFFCPDIETYRTSPGLNIDPLEAFPQAAYACAHDVVRGIEEGADAGPALISSQVPEDCCTAIARACASCLGEARI